MKIKYFSALATLLWLMNSIALANVTIGEKAPGFGLLDTSGEKRKLSDFAGKMIILEWTNHQCPFVKKHYNSKNMQNLQKKYTSEGVVWLSIISSAKGKQGNVSGAEAVKLTEDRGASPSYVLFDESGDVGRLYGAKTTPHMYIINEEGVLLYNGAIDSIRSTKTEDVPKATNYVDLAMAEIKAGNPLSKSTTRPYGCSVKY